MPVPITNLHQQRVVDQIRHNLVGLQLDMVNNAKSHKQMALAQSPNITTLLGFVSDCAAQYQRRLKWVTDLRADATRETWLLAAVQKMGWTEADITSVVGPLLTAANALANATLVTYADVAAACDSLIAFVDAPPSLWPE